MTYNDIIKTIDKVINREYPEDVVLTTVCTIEFFRSVRDIIDGYRNEAAYFEDQIDDINREHYDTICKLRGEIERLKKDYEIYEEASGLKWTKAEAVKAFVKKFEKNLKDVNFTLEQMQDIQTVLEKTSKEITEERK